MHNFKVDLVFNAFNEIESIEKGGYDHFMLKEVNEQPKSIFDTLRGRLLADKNTISIGGLNQYEKKYLNANRIIVLTNRLTISLTSG